MKIIPHYNRDLLYRYDRTMPRYTSYPTELQFQPDFSIERRREALDNSPNRVSRFRFIFISRSVGRRVSTAPAVSP